MKKILALVLYAGVMFGVTAGLGMFMMKKTAPHVTAVDGEDSEEEHEGSEGDAASTEHASPAASAEPDSSDHDEPAEIRTAEVSSPHAPGDAHGSRPGTGGSSSVAHREEQRLPVAVRATQMSVEEIVRMGLSLKNRDETVRKREQTLRETEAQQRLLLSDLTAAQQDIENLLAQATDQRAAKEELLTRITAQNAKMTTERQALAAEKDLLKTEMDKLDLARRQFEAEKGAVVQTETDLAEKRKKLEDDRKLLEDERIRITLENEKLTKDRQAWLAERDTLNEDKRKLIADREQLQSERTLLEEEKKEFVSATGKASPGTTPQPTEQDKATYLKNLKAVAQTLESMTPENAAANIKEMAGGGNSDMIVDVLMLLEPRKSGAIMDALQDEKLASDFLLKMSKKNSNSKAVKKP
jgi:hypothetical protein